MNYLDIYKILFDTSKQAGIVADMMQEGIFNEGKTVELREDEDLYSKEMREAKTKIDEIVQEMILTALYPKYKGDLSLDVEEDTQSMHKFMNHKDVNTFILDPIDGTLPYIQQKDHYSICSAVFHNHDIKVAIVYFPARDILFGYCENFGPFVYHDVKYIRWDEGIELNYLPKVIKPNIIYKNNRLSKTIVQRLLHSGYQVIDDREHHLGCPDAILACMRGDALAYISDYRNIRDILVGAILSKMKNGKAYNYKGEYIKWEMRGRQKEAVFSIYGINDLFNHMQV